MILLYEIDLREDSYTQFEEDQYILRRGKFAESVEASLDISSLKLAISPGLIRKLKIKCKLVLLETESETLYLTVILKSTLQGWILSVKLRKREKICQETWQRNLSEHTLINLTIRKMANIFHPRFCVLITNRFLRASQNIWRALYSSLQFADPHFITKSAE